MTDIVSYAYRLAVLQVLFAAVTLAFVSAPWSARSSPRHSLDLSSRGEQQRSELGVLQMTPSVQKVAIIGSGAAGLAASRAFVKNGISSVVVLEKDAWSGGVWHHVDDDRSRPMYRGLRTNLPREIMAYREKPWGNDGMSDSYVTHKQVFEYLNDYKQQFDLEKMINYGCAVTQLTVGEEEDNSSQQGSPKITLEWEEHIREGGQETKQYHSDTFDAVCICNGHYAVPAPPHVAGLEEHFKGKVMHSIEYDNPADFSDKVVLCIGARASGEDLAREISAHAKCVYLSDSTCRPLGEGGQPHTLGNVTWVPRTMKVDADSKIHFDNSCVIAPSDVDVVIFCSGYNYNFPFINEKSNLELSCKMGERRVSPLYEQLWHAKYPSISFIGLPHSVVPFPAFELQAEAIVAQYTGSAPELLPPLEERLERANADAESGGPNDPGRLADTHYLGSHQWDYCRKMARMAGLCDDAMENFIATNKIIYEDASQRRKGVFPGGPDDYRANCYIRDDGTQSFQMVVNKVVKEPSSVA